jgi:hypothetical protein
MAAVDPIGVFASTVLPVLALAAVGYVLGAWQDVDVDPLNTVLLYVLLPALVFHSLVTSSLGGAATLKLGGAVWLFTFLMMGIAAGVAHLAGESGATFSAVVLAAAFPNVGNFGIPVSTFAFGEVGRNVAVLFVVAQNVLTLTIGVYVAARGGGEAGRGALRRVFELPLVYVVALAGVVLWAGAVPPTDGAFMRTVELSGNASIPLFILVLGIQLAKTDAGAALRRTVPAVGLKLFVAPAVALGVALAVGFSDPTVARTFVLESAAPVAITPLALLIEFTDDEGAVSGRNYISTAIFVTTLGSIPVVTGLITLLRAGVLV